MLRDIDYAAVAVKTALVEKFGRQQELKDLSVTANEKTISIDYGGNTAEGTRDDLLAAVRKAKTFDELWPLLPSSVRR